MKMLARLIAPTKARPDSAARRALIIAAALVLWMCGIGVRLVYLQASTMHEWLKERGRAQQQGTAETSAVRGVVLDRAGRDLARSIETTSFFAVPSEIKDIEDEAMRFAAIAGADKAAIIARLTEAQQQNRKFVWLARKLDARQAEKIGALELAGVYMLPEPKRFYPNGALAAHVLGFVGLDETGLGGVEQVYNERIKGEPGKVFVETDAHRRSYASFEAQPNPGQSIMLTIDQMIQYRTEAALAAAVERTHAKSGTAIVLDPHTGDVLALANAPTFDPNDARTASPQARANGALQNIYEPGSTFKIVAYSAAIEKGLAKPDDKIDCQMGSITVAGRLIHDHHPFGTLTLTDALGKSSNVAAIKLGLRVGNNSMYDFIRRFGFGARTGIELPGETPGLVRPVERWQPSSIGSIAMGQEIGVTPLQVAAAFGALANDGVRVAPHLVKEIRAGSGAVVYQAAPEAHRVVRPDTAQALRGMLEGVTLNGTAKRAQLDGYTAAGKTGTAQKIDPQTHAYSKTKYIGSFVGFAPVENPAVVIVVVIDEPVGSYHGGDVAAPVFREIAESILPDMNVAPDTDIKPSQGAPDARAQSPRALEAMQKAREELEREAAEREATLPQEEAMMSASAGNDQRESESKVVYAAATQRGVLMPNLYGRSVRDAARTCAQLGLQLEARGEGRARRQTPQAGTELDAGQIVTVEFKRSD